ncbi:MAG: universal stress protein [Proteobacteria bacterium]|nr:universal stress protein [Pseudomonadota bacterium]MBU4297201.1 universal stress protein [Pseudomonadota bacterium]MCG2748509.1 universal stress protein [Desulfobulbaceae bacterium]
MKKKILVAVDGSYCSLHEIHYLSKLFGEHGDISIHLITIVSGSLPPSSEWLDEEDKMNMLSSEARKKINLTKKYLREETAFFIHHGLKEDQVTSDIQLSRSGVANDLILEMQKGTYDALVIARRGLGKLQELVLGSVTTTILEKCFNVPIWIIDGEIDSRRFLVPVDGSWRTLKAVDHLGFMLANVEGAEIALFHSLSWLTPKKLLGLDQFCDIWGKQWCDEHLTGPDAIFSGPEQLLRENGFDMTKVIRIEESRGPVAALDIILELRDNQYGTIVMGRRGPDEPKGIFGGVSGQVLRTVNGVAVWLVN